MASDAVILIVALYLVIKGATLATKHAAELAGGYRLSKYTVGFIIIAIISILPETFISVNSAIKGIPAFGFGTLLGSNIADLTLVFAIIIFLAGRKLKIESKILKNHFLYPLVLLLPLILGFDGHYSRLEGLALIVAGIIFYFVALRNGRSGEAVPMSAKRRYENILMLVFSMGILLIGSYFIVLSATSLATALGISSTLIGLLLVGLGTTVPELSFSLNSVKGRQDSLAVGDILGTVLADATIVVGIMATISPFAVPQRIIYATGAFMVAAAFMLFHFMRTGRTLTSREAVALFAYWAVFVAVEFMING